MHLPTKIKLNIMLLLLEGDFYGNKKLCIAETPIRCHLHHAFALNMILNQKLFVPWYFSEFIQIFATPQSYDKNLYLIKLRNGIKYEFNLYKVYNRLFEYVYSKSSWNKETLIDIKSPENNPAWGMDCYKNLRRYIENLYNTGKSSSLIPLHLWWEHKKVMCQRIEYMNKNNFVNDTSNLIDSYKIVAEKFLTIRNRMLKYNMTKNKRLINSILNDLSYIENKEKVILLQLLKDIQKNLYSEWIINAVANRVPEGQAPLLENKKYLTIIVDCKDVEETALWDNINNNKDLETGWILWENRHKNYLNECKNHLLNNDKNCLILESENATNIYSMPFKAEYLYIFSQNNEFEKSNIILIHNNNITEIGKELYKLSATPTKNPQFIILFIKNNFLNMDMIDSLLNQFSCYSIMSPYSFFHLYRNACGYELNQNIYMDSNCNINSIAYSKQSGNCLCGNTNRGSYITLKNNDWVYFKNIKCVGNALDYIFFYINNIISNGEIQVILNSLDGEIICDCKIEQTDDMQFKAYRSDLKINESIIEYGNHIDIYIKAIGTDDFGFDFYGYKFYAINNTNSYFLNHLNYQKADNNIDVVKENSENYKILLKNQSWMLYENLFFEKQFCELELIIENGCKDDIIYIVLENETTFMKNTIILPNNEKIQAVFATFKSLSGEYNIKIQYDPKHRENIIKLQSIKCNIDIFKKIKAIEYSKYNNIQQELLQDEGYIVAFAQSDSYVCYNNVNFYNNISSFHVLASGERVWNKGTLEIRVDNINGVLIGKCEITNTGSWKIYNEFICKVNNINGHHNLYLIFKGVENEYLFNIKTFWFE